MDLLLAASTVVTASCGSREPVDPAADAKSLRTVIYLEGGNLEPSYDLDLDQILLLNGERYDAKESKLAEPHFEILTWYSANYPVRAVETAHGLNLVPMTGVDREEKVERDMRRNGLTWENVAQLRDGWVPRRADGYTSIQQVRAQLSSPRE